MNSLVIYSVLLILCNFVSHLYLSAIYSVLDKFHIQSHLRGCWIGECICVCMYVWFEHNKPKAAVHPERMPTGPKKEEMYVWLEWLFHWLVYCTHSIPKVLTQLHIAHTSVVSYTNTHILHKSHFAYTHMEPGHHSQQWLGHGLDDPGFKSPQGQEMSLFFRMARPALRPTHPPTQVGSRSSCIRRTATEACDWPLTSF
jgi:hypothetical protein